MARREGATPDLTGKVESLPTGPGVYQFKSAGGAVLYVGKAQNLRARLRQYVQGGDGRARIPALMERAADVEVLVTATAKEALLLENELIKQHRPPFNVRLRDDKQYLGLRLDEKEAWPRLTPVRRFRRDGAHYFGPYTSNVALKEVLSNLRRLFPLRSCSEAVYRDYARRGRPCIEFEMKRCLAPCCGRVDEAAYADQVRGTLLFLRGRSSQLVSELQEQMREAAAGERFEEAARLRNRIAAVESTLEQQEIVAPAALDRDVFALAREGSEALLQVLHVREGRVVAAEDYGFSGVCLDDGEVISSFLGQYYGDAESRPAPSEILCSADFDDGGALRELLVERGGRAVSIRRPQRGGPRRLLAIAERNAELALRQRFARRESVEAALSELQAECALAVLPRRIECYDVSHLQGSLAVASRVVFEDGQPQKQHFRRYRIQEAAAGDDVACLREVLGRRLARVASEPLPDLLMVDGGRGQLAVVSAALADAGLAVETLGLSKQRDAESKGPRVRRSGGLKAERVHRPGRSNPILLPAGSRGLLLLQRVRDESHRFAIGFQRELRSQLGLTSVLEELPGIGPAKRRALLRALGSLRAVRAASEEALQAVPGITQRDARVLRRFFAAAPPGDSQAGHDEPGS